MSNTMLVALVLSALAGPAQVPPHALYVQALDYYNGQHGVQADRLKAGELFLEAANAGDPDAEYTVGRMYQNGLAGVQKNVADARFWYEKGAAHGQLEALASLGGIYAGGAGVARDYVKALDYYHRAAERGHARSLYEISAMTVQGFGVAPSPREAYMWRLLSVRLAPDDEVAEYRKGLAILTPDVDPDVRAAAAVRANEWMRLHKLKARNP